ncbi:ABC transporter ATP-binding protein/permease [Leptolyngbya sp. ST-U4]|uniref:ABC transporter ATP-binding protein/permease n=1 Tax=Leptolyngbya sp. ST-U4 TaxID=2933912 RepID=UPI00329A2216
MTTATAPNSSQESLRRLSRFDWKLWNRFVAIAQPYWYPTRPGSGKVFFGLLVLLIVFLFAFLFVLISGVTMLCQQLFPQFMEQTAGGFVGLVRAVWTSPGVAIVLTALLIPAIGFFLARRNVLPRWRQWLLLSSLLLLSLAVSGLNVTISYVSNFFMTALADKDQPTFWLFLFVYAGVFVVGTPIVVIYSYLQDVLGLYWREWMTGKFLNEYFSNRAYYEINNDENIDNPDQRISEDIRGFTNTSLYYLLLILGAVLDLISFTGILWSISRTLSVFLIGYAIFGTIVVAIFGKRLITLNFLQLKREADFRYGLIHVRDNAESIAFYRGENQEIGQLGQRFNRVLQNFNFLIRWQRNLSFFTKGYEYAIVILPSLIMAPLFFAGQIQFGDITQANFAFSQVLAAFAVFVLYGQVERISAFAAGINRLETFTEALQEQDKIYPEGQTKIDLVEEPQISLNRVTLQTPKGQRTLTSDLSMTLQPGQGLVIVGQSGVGKSSMLRAIAGLWNTGTGRIGRPNLKEMLFLPQRPYMVLGTLRDQLLYPNLENNAVNDEDVYRVLKQVNLADLPERVGGFDVILDWSDVLSLGEQQRLAFARLLLTKPRYAILDEATSALDLANEQRLYQTLRDTQTTFISVGHRTSLLKYHDYVLKLEPDTSWQLVPTEEYKVDLEAFA